MSIVTKTGDRGETSLMYGHRVPKNDARVDAYGCVDELTAALGLARSVATDKFISDEVLAVPKRSDRCHGRTRNSARRSRALR